MRGKGEEKWEDLFFFFFSLRWGEMRWEERERILTEMLWLAQNNERKENWSEKISSDWLKIGKVIDGDFVAERESLQTEKDRKKTEERQKKILSQLEHFFTSNITRVHMWDKRNRLDYFLCRYIGVYSYTWVSLILMSPYIFFFIRTPFFSSRPGILPLYLANLPNSFFQESEVSLLWDKRISVFLLSLKIKP